MNASLAPTLLADGFAIAESGLEEAALEDLRQAVAPILAEHAGRGGVRNALARVPALGPVIAGPLRDLVRPYFDTAPVAVRVLLFDKTPVANWKVTWHQDVTIGVTDYEEKAGWGPWSRKDGGWHVRAPAPVLADMLTARLHLDPCGPANGPLRVIPGTHRFGRLGDGEIESASRRALPVDCLVPAGGVLLLRPLLLHSSAPAAEPSRRRVLHVEFAGRALPNGLRWAEPFPEAPHP